MNVVPLHPTPVDVPTQTWAPDRKFVPDTVTLAKVPACALDGLREVIVGTTVGAVIVNGNELEGPPPGDGLETVTCAVPAVANAEAGTKALKNVWSEEIKKVWAAVPLKLSVALAAKFVPPAKI